MEHELTEIVVEMKTESAEFKYFLDVHQRVFGLTLKYQLKFGDLRVVTYIYG